MDGPLTCRAPSTPESSAHTGGSGCANMCALLHSHHQGHCATTEVAAGHSHGVGKHAPWIRAMLMNSYFGSCHTHAQQKKNECTYFCITCGYDNPHSLCQHCIVDHTGHSMIQIRRYVYCDVIRAVDISPHIDITGVQNYIINQAKVLFLNHRPQAKKGSPTSADVCRTCCRTLREGYLYCSLACKVDSLSSNATAAPNGVRALASPGGGSSDDSCEEEEALMEEDEVPVQPTARATAYRAPREACVAMPPNKRQCVQPRLFRQSSDSSTEEAFPAHLTLATSFSMESLLAACGCSNNQTSGDGSSPRELMRSKLSRNNSRRKQFSPRQAPCV